MSYCFISDLHLNQDRPDITKAFLNFLENTACKAEKLYILGDLFEAWIGDDDQNEFISEIQNALIRINKTTKVLFMHGNRDFLIGPDFASSAGMKILTDPVVEEMFGDPVLLMHGDLLCTEDIDYQKFRKVSRDINWQKEFLSKPLAERRIIAQNLRGASKEATGKKKEEIMDVSECEVIKIIQESSVSLLIHGHTHRPNSHSIALEKHTAKRIVLGDWDEYGWYVWMDSNSCELNKFSIS